MRVTISALLAAILVASPVHAEVLADVAGWQIERGESTCSLGSEFAGPGDTYLVVGMDIEGDMIVMVRNTNWSVEAKKTYKVAIEMDGYGKWMIAEGFKDGYKPTWLSTMPPDSKAFQAAFAKSSYINFYIDRSEGEKFNEDKEIVLDQLDLKGSAAALTRVKGCATTLKAKLNAEAAAKAAYQQRWAHIPKDPFAKPQGPTANAGQPQLVGGAVHSLLRNDDYPDAAAQAGEEGVVAFKLSVGPDGRVTNCAVTQSSGSLSLDSATCRILRARARFTPATDASGDPTSGTFDGRIVWRLEEELAPAPVTSATQ